MKNKGSTPEEFVTINAVCGEELMWRWEELRRRIQQLMWSEEQQEAFKQDHSVLITPYTILKIMEELEK